MMNVSFRVFKAALFRWFLIGAALGFPSLAGAWTSADVQNVLDELPAGCIHQHEMLEMRDGIRLSTHYFLPAGYQTTNYPVVMMRSAYNWWPDKGVYAKNYLVDQSSPTYVWRNTNGVVFVVQDLRGDGDSEAGVGFEPRLSDNEIHDTYDTVESLATNSWCDGNVGMVGGSGHGMAPFMGYLSKAPHLKVISVGNTGPNLYEHWSFENGVRRWIYDWLDNRNTTTPTWPKPTLGEYYDRQAWNQLNQTGGVDNATILIHDGDYWHNFFLDSTFEAFKNWSAQGNVYMSMDYGTHQGNWPELKFPFGSTQPEMRKLPSMLEILDGATIETNSFLEYYVMGDARRGASAEGNFRRTANSWPPPALPTAFYLHADGTLSMAKPSSTTDTLSYDYHPTNPVPTVGGNYSYGFVDDSGALNQLVPELTNRTDILRFETAPFTEATEITGVLNAELYVSTDVEDTTFMVKLIDMYPAENGDPEYHAIMRESAIMGRYWGGLTNPAPMVSGTIYRLDIDMSSISLMMETGHRLGLHITSSSDKAFEVHPNTYSQVFDYASSPTAHNTLHLNTNYPSRIILPYYLGTNGASVAASSATVFAPEGGVTNFTIHMEGVALDTVTVAVQRISGDTDLSVTGATEFVFTTNNWFTPQAVSIAAADDADWSTGSAVFRCSAPGVAPVDVTVTEIDPDTNPSLILPFSETFETNSPMAGTLGSVDGQHGWTAAPVNSAVVVDTAAQAGSQSCELDGGTLSHAFTDEQTNVWLSLWMQPAFGATNADISAGASAVFYVNTNGNVVAYSNTTPVILTGVTLTEGAWAEFQIHADYSAATWELSVNGTNLLSGFSFYDSPASFGKLEIIESVATSRVDSVDIALSGPTDGDTDSDGIPDSWETQYFYGPTNANPDATASNGVNTVLEAYIAGLDPTDPNDIFEMTNFSALSLTNILQWQGVSGRVYTIYWTSNLLDGFSVPCGTNYSDGIFTDLLHGAENEGFYQINVEIGP